jgi:transposase-like protein
VSHRNARLTVHGRRLLIERVCAGRPVAHVAAETGISRATGNKWVRRWRAEGEAGLADRTGRPRTTPHRTSPAVEARVCLLRQARKPGPARLGPARRPASPARLGPARRPASPARLGPVLGLPASTVHRVLVTCAGFPRRSAAFFTTCGIDRIERVLTDNAWPIRP